MPHTPGPWEYREDQYGNYVCSLAPDAPSYGTDPRPVDLLEDGRKDDHRLMAAAPELLSALKLIRRQWGGHSEVCYYIISKYRGKCDCDWPKIATACDTAIAKAEAQ